MEEKEFGITKCINDAISEGAFWKSPVHFNFEETNAGLKTGSASDIKVEFL